MGPLDRFGKFGNIRAERFLHYPFFRVHGSFIIKIRGSGTGPGYPPGRVFCAAVAGHSRNMRFELVQHKFNWFTVTTLDNFVLTSMIHATDRQKMLFRIASMRLLTHTVVININSPDIVRLFIIKLDAVAYACPCLVCPAGQQNYPWSETGRNQKPVGNG